MFFALRAPSESDLDLNFSILQSRDSLLINLRERSLLANLRFIFNPGFPGAECDLVKSRLWLQSKYTSCRVFSGIVVWCLSSGIGLSQEPCCLCCLVSSSRDWTIPRVLLLILFGLVLTQRPVWVRLFPTPSIIWKPTRPTWFSKGLHMK